MTNKERLKIALELLGLKDEIVKKGKTITGDPQIFKMLGADGPFTEFNVGQPGPNQGTKENPVFYYIPDVLEKYGLSRVQAKNILMLMQGAFDQETKRRLLFPVCEILDSIPEPKTDENKLKWIATSSELAFIISELVDKGYIDAPKKQGNDINYYTLADQILNSFSGQNLGKRETLARNMNPDDEEKGMRENSRKEFVIPDYIKIAKK